MKRYRESGLIGRRSTEAGVCCDYHCCIGNGITWVGRSVTVDAPHTLIRHPAANVTLRCMNILEKRLIVCMELIHRDD